MLFIKNGLTEIRYSENESEAVKIAAVNLKSDLFKVLESRVYLHCVGDETSAPVFGVQNGPCALSGHVRYPDAGAVRTIFVASREHLGDLLPDAAAVGALIPSHKEGFAVAVRDGCLYLCGNDRRGTIYAVYEFCERLGVSPWHFFADVPPKRRDSYEIEEGFTFADHPSVEYRGIFINDEEELEKWVVGHMGEPTIGPKTYAHIFELLLRLKCNYLWPAMHVNSFNANVENGALAEKMGVVIGTSHCDMLMRSNNREWEPWKKKKGYDNAVYDFSIEGENRERLLEYWRESVEQNKDFEVTYTLGMRGIHDSGFNTQALSGLSGDALLKGKIDLLSQVFRAQDQILKEVPHKEALKLFVPYKEVLELYDNGLDVPDDYTLIWTNDNYGHVRRYPDEAARGRKGGHGIYYHQSYWAPPDTSYLFICSIPAAQTRYELSKAYENGIRTLWVTNFGAIKPLEQHLSYYAALAWNIGKENDPTADVERFLAEWLDRTFSGGFGAKLSPLLTAFDQVVNMRKIELLDNGVFYQSAGQDDAAGRIHFLRHVFDTANEIYSGLPQEERDAFFEMVLLRVHAAYYANAMYYYADRSLLLSGLGRKEEADASYDLAADYDRARQALLYYYNHILADGKWNGIVTPEDYPPPRTAMYPAACSPRMLREAGLPAAGRPLPVNDPVNRVTVEACDAEELATIRRAAQSAGISNDPGEAAAGGLTGPAKLQSAETPDELCRASGSARLHATSRPDNSPLPGIRIIRCLGRGCGDLVEFASPDAVLTYRLDIPAAGEYTLTLERFPSLNSVGEIGIDAGLDGRFVKRLVSDANDEHRGSWRENILNDRELLTVPLGHLEAGPHTLTLFGATRYFALTRFHIYDRLASMGNHFWHGVGLNPYLDNHETPAPADLAQTVRRFYPGAVPGERPELLVPAGFSASSVANEIIYWPVSAQAPVPAPFSGPDCVVLRAADALLETDRAHTLGAAPDCCTGVGRKEVSLYCRDQQLLEDSPAGCGVCFRTETAQGRYTLWLCLYMKGAAECCFDLAVDKTPVFPKAEDARRLWHYSQENTYAWVPVTSLELAGGSHTVTFFFRKTRLRLEKIVLQRETACAG